MNIFAIYIIYLFYFILFLSFYLFLSENLIRNGIGAVTARYKIADS